MQMWRSGGIEVMETTQKMEHRQDITVVDRAAQERTFVDFLVPWDRNLVTKKMGKSPSTLLCQRKAGRCIGC